MTGTAFSAVQMAEFSTTVSGALTVALPKVAVKFGEPKKVLASIKDKSELLASRLEIAVQEVIKGMMVLSRGPQVQVLIPEKFNRDDFYRARDGLYMYDDFRTHVLARAKYYDAGLKLKINIDDLGTALSNEQITNSLQKNYVWDESALCAVIAEMIGGQSTGKQGALAVEGAVNLFYTASCVVDLAWDSTDRAWEIGALERTDRISDWAAGSRVFSLAG